jgi:ribonuclease P protein component
VDDLPFDVPPKVGQWIGAVVPKRHARRAVTRSLIKRQIYAAAERHRGALGFGLWVVRLRAPFEKARFASAASAALKLCTRSELEALFAAAARLGQSVPA